MIYCNPLISVILPVFNAEKYITDAVNSILDQTFQDFELIVINDGSNDKTAVLLERLAQEDSRIKLISRENKGLVVSLNEGIDMAKGFWIARMDADDIASHNRFERQLECLHKTKADICGTGVQRFGKFDQRIFLPRISDAAIKMQMLFSCPFAHPTVMMRSSVAKELRYDKNYEKVEDYDLWERAAHAGWKMANVPEVLLRYRVHSNQISTSSLSIQQDISLQIKRRYWGRVFTTLGVEWRDVEELLELLGSKQSNPDMDAIDRLFTSLLDRSQGESRDVILSQITHAYLRVAANQPNAFSRWECFFSKQRKNRLLRMRLIFLLLRWCRIRIQNHGSHRILRLLYRYFVR